MSTLVELPPAPPERPRLRNAASVGLRIVQAVLIAGLVLGGVFVVLTRTQVGRDGLRRQVERQFSEQFKGKVRIGTLKGNLVNDLYAGDVRLLDPQGNTVLSADSVVLRPRWQDLLKREVSIGSVTLYRPSVKLIRQADGSWTIAQALQRRTPATALPDSAALPWRINPTDIRIIDGTLSTVNRGAVPERVQARRLFDYTATTLRDLDAEATVVWRTDERRVTLKQLSGDWTSLGLPIHGVEGTVGLQENAVLVSDFVLQAGETTVALSGTVDHLAAIRAKRLGDLGVELELRTSRISLADVRRFLPTLPLADALVMEGRVSGTVAALNVQSLRAERGQTRVVAEGILRGLPENLNYDVRLLPSTVAVQDVQALWPEAPLEPYRQIGVVRVDLTSGGRIALADSGVAAIRSITSAFNIGSSAGSAAGKVSLNGSRPGALAYTAGIRVQGLDVARLTGRPALSSRLGGTVLLNGSGLSADDLNARVRLDLFSSTFAGRTLDTFAVVADVRNRRATGTARLAQGAGTVDAVGTVDLSGAVPGYDVDLTARNVDLGVLLLSDSLQSRLSGRATLTGQGASLADLGGRLDVSLDSSMVYHGNRQSVIPAHRNRLEIVHPSMGAPYVMLEGDIATVRLDGDIALAPLLALSRLWGTAAVRMLAQELNKPSPTGRTEGFTLELAGAPAEAEAVTREQDAMRSAARASLADAGLPGGLSTTAELELHRPDILTALLPSVPPLQADLKGHLEFSGNADSLAFSGDVSASTVQVGNVRTSAFRTSIEAAGSLDQPLDQTLSFTLDVGMDSLIAPGYSAANPSLVLHYRNRSGEVSFTTRGGKNTGPVQLAATLDLLPHVNRLTLYNFRLSAGGYQWTTTEDYPIDIYSNALEIPGLTLQSWTSDSGAPQRVRLYGTLSAEPGSTLYAEAENISLRQISGLFKMKKPVHGLLNGRLALAGGLARPELTGTIEVPAIVHDGKVLGKLTVQSQYIPGSPDVALDVAVAPVEFAGARSDAEAEELPPGKLALKENEIRLGGTFRLPEVNRVGGIGDPGRLELTLDLARADLSPFETLFPTLLASVEGYATGSGTVTGTFLKPVPDLALEVRDGAFRIPEYRLAYTASGPVRVDEAGVWIDRAMLRDNTGGSARLSGAIRFNDYEYLSLDLRGQLDRLQIMNVMQSRHLSFYGRIWASGSAALRGRLEDALLSSPDAVVTPESEVFIPVQETGTTVDPGFIIMADSAGNLPDLAQAGPQVTRNGAKVRTKRNFVEGLGMDLNLTAPEGTTVHLVIDPLLGDMINAVGNGRIQLQLREGDFYVYGGLDVTSGDYLFTAGDVFARRFLVDEGQLTWTGDPLNPTLDIAAAYQTRASTEGLEPTPRTVPLLVRLNVTGPMIAPEIGLSLAVDRRNRDLVGDELALEGALNDAEQSATYATSVLLTNSFLLTTDLQDARQDAGSTTTSLAFNSVSQLVMSQLNRYIGAALPNLDVNFGFQGERVEDLDVTYGLALHLLNDRLVISSSGVVRQNGGERYEGEFTVAFKLSRNVAAEIFYRKEDDLGGSAGAQGAATTNTAGAGLSYETEFSSWSRLTQWLFGGSGPDSTDGPPEARPEALPPSGVTAGVE